MELPLSADGKSAIDLQGLRTLVKGGNNNGTSTFYVEVKMDATIPGAGLKLLQAIRLKVNVANIENVNHFYSNYKVVLTAEILDRNNKAVMNTHKDDNIIYTLQRSNRNLSSRDGVSRLFFWSHG